MGLTSGEILDVVEIIYYAPALLITLFIAFRHGFRRSNGWLYLIPLGVVRIVGGILSIVATENPNKTEAEVAAILSSVGLSLIIQALVGLIRRINEGIHKDHNINPRFIDLITIPVIIGIVFAIRGGTMMASGDPGDYSNGQDEFKVSGFLFLAVVVGVAGLVAMAAVRKHWLPDGEFKFIIAMAICIPFLMLRVIYVLCISFASAGSSTFNLLRPDVAVEGVMSIMPEFVSVAVLLLVGICSKRAKDVTKVGPPPQYEMPERNKYQTYPSSEQAWRPSVPAQSRRADHIYAPMV